LPRSWLSQSALGAEHSLFLNFIDLIRWMMRRTYPSACRPANDRF